MQANLKGRTELTVQSYNYIAGKLATSRDFLSPATLYEEILAEAEKHCGALRLMQRDVMDSTNAHLRNKSLSESKYLELRESAIDTIGRAHEAIARIASQYAPQKMAA